MSSGPNLHEYLTAQAAVAALVGDRVYPELIPQHVYAEVRGMPCIVYQRVAVSRSRTYCAADKLVKATIQVDVMAPTYDEADQVAEAVRLALLDYRGAMGDVRVKLCQLDTETNLVESEPGLFRCSRDWSFWYVEP